MIASFMESDLDLVSAAARQSTLPVAPFTVKQPAPEIAEALGLGRKRTARRRADGVTCEDCFFYRQMLCALDLDEPCSTFRADSPDGLVPPRQPSLLPRA